VPEALVKTSFPGGEATLPLVIEPEVENVNLPAWAASNRERVESELLKYGAVLFRGFNMETVRQFEQLACAVSLKLLDYKERSSPRSEVGHGVYTSTDYPANQTIHFHNEQSYSDSWPMKLWFFCLQPAAEGGATLIADGREVLRRISARTRERFEQKQVLYVRNYGDNMGLDWKAAFQTTEKSAVESYCRRAGIDFEWRGGDRLRTRQVFPAIVAHPKTGEPLWFEHTAFFHVSSLEPTVREMLLAEFGEQDLPFNTYYADGSPLTEDVLHEIREAYEQSAVRFPWRQRDVLLIDNMLTSHGREPFAGPRRVVVAMTELHYRGDDAMPPAPPV
jgi:alpha-ketoglutarate-dependent taurine dioxygenase